MKEVHRAKVLYADTDSMGIVYYAIYLRWFEIGRAELLRKSNLVYKEMNDIGVHLPVIETGCRYLRPAKYDDEIRIFSSIGHIKRARIRFEYRIESGGEILTTGFTEHAFTDRTGKPVRPPGDIFRRLQKVRDAV